MFNNFVKNLKEKIVMTKTNTRKLPTGVDYVESREAYRARKNGIHLGYFTSAKKAALALNAITNGGVYLDVSRTGAPFKAIKNGKHVGYFWTRTAAVQALIAA
jgi:hypothetical protein